MCVIILCVFEANQCLLNRMLISVSSSLFISACLNVREGVCRSHSLCFFFCVLLYFVLRLRSWSKFSWSKPHIWLRWVVVVSRWRSILYEYMRWPQQQAYLLFYFGSSLKRTRLKFCRNTAETINIRGEYNFAIDAEQLLLPHTRLFS